MTVARALVVGVVVGLGAFVPWAAAQPAPAAGGSSAPAGSAAPAAPGASASAAPKPPGVTGGYSWSDKKKGHAHAGRARIRSRGRLKFDPKAPMATYPGFRMLPDGRSLVFVNVSQRVDVQVRRSGNRIAYVLTGADVAVRNNTNALVTTYFDTPLSRARLVPAKGGAQLVLELRQSVQPTYRVDALPSGWVVVQITLPAPAGAAAAP